MNRLRKRIKWLSKRSVCLLMCLTVHFSVFATQTTQAQRNELAHETKPLLKTVFLTNGEWPPYLSQSLPNYGFASHVVTEAFANVGIEVKYGFFPWKRSYRYAKQGYSAGVKAWHGSVVWVHTPKRALSFQFSDVVVEENEHLFHLKSSGLEWERIEDLYGLIIGGTLHTVYPDLESAERQGLLTIDRDGNYDLLFKKLLHRGIDAVPFVKHVGHYFIQSQLSAEQAAQIVFAPTVLDKRDYYVMFSKETDPNGQLLALFNQGLAQLKSSGRYQQMLRHLQEGVYHHRISPPMIN